MFVSGNSVVYVQCYILTFFCNVQINKYNFEEILSSLKVILVTFAENSLEMDCF